MPLVTRRNDDLAPTLRHDQTDVERTLWDALCNRQLAGAKFRRQVPIGPDVVDFACLAAMLVIELDGDQHATESPARQAWLESQDFRVLRFWNHELIDDKSGVLTAIVDALTPALSRRERVQETADLP